MPLNFNDPDFWEKTAAVKKEVIKAMGGGMGAAVNDLKNAAAKPTPKSFTGISPIPPAKANHPAPQDNPNKPPGKLVASGKDKKPGNHVPVNSPAKPDFSVKHGPVPNTPKPAPNKPAPSRQAPAQTRSPAANVNATQFGNTGYTGKRRAPQGKHAAPAPLPGSAYRGSHAKGAHAMDYDLQSDLDKSRAKKQHVGAHSARAPKPVGKHGKPYNPQADIQKNLNNKGKAVYVPKHTPQGQAQRAQALRIKARQDKLNSIHGTLKKAHMNVHQFRKLAGGRHYSEHLRAMETKV